MIKKRHLKKPTPALDLDQVKRRVIVAMFSDDDFMDRFVLKGGNALDIVHRVSARASLDVDLSMESSFGDDSLDEVRMRIERALSATFRADGLEVFDLRMEESIPNISPEIADFWGGYAIEFKLVDRETYLALGHGDIELLRRHSLKIGAKGKFTIDLSKHEYVKGKRAEPLDGFQIFVYTPEMIVAEKLRAICQQMPEYGPIVLRSRPGAPRARDYVDIHTLVENRQLDMLADQNVELCARMFQIKRVPLSLLGKLPAHREHHRMDWQRVVDNVKPGFPLRTFEFYAGYVEALAERLGKQLLGRNQSPFGT